MPGEYLPGYDNLTAEQRAAMERSAIEWRERPHRVSVLYVGFSEFMDSSLDNIAAMYRGVCGGSGSDGCNRDRQYGFRTSTAARSFVGRLRRDARTQSQLVNVRLTKPEGGDDGE